MIKIVLKITISSLLIWWLIGQTDVNQIIDNMSTVDPWGILYSAGIMLLLSALQSLRWFIVIRSINSEINYRDAFHNVLVGNFFNQTLPSSIGGDAVRMWRAYQHGLSSVAAIHSVILDRLTALAALVLMAALGMPWMFSLLGKTPERWAIPLIVGSVILTYAALLLFDKLPIQSTSWRPFQTIANLSSNARRVMLNLNVMWQILSISILIHLGVGFAVFVIVTAMALPIDLIDCLILVPPVILISMVPISIAGWGVRESAMVTAFALVGIGNNEAFALSVLFGLVMMLTGIPGGVLWLLSKNRNRSKKDSEKLFEAAIQNRDDVDLNSSHHEKR